MTKEEVLADIAKIEQELKTVVADIVQRAKNLLAKVEAVEHNLLHKATPVAAAVTAPTLEAKPNDSQTPNGQPNP